MPSYRELMSMPHDPLIGAAVRQDRSIKVGQRIAAAVEARQRDPALVAFERGDHMPAETHQEDVGAEEYICRKTLERQARDAETMRKQREASGWVPCNGAESLRGIAFRWFKLDTGGPNRRPIEDQSKREHILNDPWRGLVTIVAYSTAEECPK